MGGVGSLKSRCRSLAKHLTFDSHADLAGDILEGLIDAPEEGDGILEMYRPVNEMETGLRSADDRDVEIIESMGIDPGLEDETEARNLASPVEDQRQGR